MKATKMKTHKTSQNGTAKRKSVERGKAYQTGYSRINSSIEEGYPIEAIAIEEAIISDRLSSHVGYHESLPKEKHTPLGTLVKKMRKHSKDSESIALADRIDEWREERNAAIHGIIKSTPSIDPEIFLKNAEKTAEDGEQLAHDVCDWHRKEKRKTTKLRSLKQ
jgi:23S rRNA pseudoU1915 N3-methylase RlmH